MSAWIEVLCYQEGCFSGWRDEKISQNWWQLHILSCILMHRHAGEISRTQNPFEPLSAPTTLIVQTNFTREGGKSHQSPKYTDLRYKERGFDTGPGFVAGFMIQIPLCSVLSPATLCNRCNAMTQQGWVHTILHCVFLKTWRFLHGIVCESPGDLGRPLFLLTVLVSSVKLCRLGLNGSWIPHCMNPSPINYTGKMSIKCAKQGGYNLNAICMHPEDCHFALPE